MAKKSKPANGSYDLSAKVEQSAVDKLLNATTFPLTIVSAQTGPPGNLYTSNAVNDDEVTLSDKRTRELLKAFANSNGSKTGKIPDVKDVDSKFHSEALSNISEVITNAKACLDAMDAPRTQTLPGQTYSFPDRKFVEGIVHGGVEGLMDSAKGLALKAICSDLRVIVTKRPNLGLNGTKISVSNTDVTVKATGELWAHVPSLSCSKWCTNWTVSWRWIRLASVSVSVDFTLDAFIALVISGKIIYAKGHVNRLRLDYPILKEIPLEGIANGQLDNKLIQVFDAGSFVACVPVINSKFGIDAISIPNVPGSLEIDITVKKL